MILKNQIKWILVDGVERAKIVKVNLDAQILELQRDKTQLEVIFYN